MAVEPIEDQLSDVHTTLWTDFNSFLQSLLNNAIFSYLLMFYKLYDYVQRHS